MAELDLLPGDTSSATFGVLKVVAVGGIVASAVVAPNIISVLAGFFKQPKDAKTLRAIRYARDNGWLTLRDTPTGVEVALTKTGKIKWQKLLLEQPIPSQKWDGKWRLVVFDVPVSRRANSDAFRASLKRLGFKQFQKSIWIIPYPCQTEVAALRQIYNLKPYVRLMETLAVDDETSLKQLFRLK